MELINSYSDLIQSLREEIKLARIKAHLSVNRELIKLYWNVGKRILQSQKKEKWGSKVIENISVNLRKEFPGMKGLSTQNLSYMRQFASEYSSPEILQQAVGEIPWGHITILLDKINQSEKKRSRV